MTFVLNGLAAGWRVEIFTTEHRGMHTEITEVIQLVVPSEIRFLKFHVSICMTIINLPWRRQSGLCLQNPYGLKHHSILRWQIVQRLPFRIAR